MGDSWHTALEKELIRTFGGTPRESYGPDGTINGDPVEVRVAREEDRFRVNEDTHQTLLEEGGSYVFDDVSDNQPPKQVPASTVDDGLTPWFDDRDYSHAFPMWTIYFSRDPTFRARQRE